MKTTNRHALAAFVRNRRSELELTSRGLAHVSGVDESTIRTIEAEKMPYPRVDTIRALAAGLQVPLADMYAAINWLPEGDLPSLRPYMRAKFDGLSEADVAKVERYISRLSSSGPRPGEDE